MQPTRWFFVVLVVLGCSSAVPPSEGPRASKQLGLAVEVGSLAVELRLQRNDHLFAPGFTEQRWEKGALHDAGVSELPLATDCYYQGTARSAEGATGIAAVNTCSEDGALRGWIQLGNDWLRLDSDEQGRVRGTRWRGATSTVLGEARVRRLAPSAVGVSSQALSAPTKYLELLVLSDHHAFAREKGETLQVVADTVNAADALIRNGQLSPVVQITLSAHVTFVDAEPWASGDVLDGDLTLQAMSSWLAQPGSPTARDETFLFTGTDLAVSDGATPPVYNTSVVGYARTSAVCSSYSQGIIEDRSRVVGYRGMVLAHELGHAFSLSHDTGIMSPSAGDSNFPTTWSATSISTWSSFFANTYPGIPACLENVAVPVGSSCGDGVVNVGEQCDCASSDCSELDPCCDGATCQFQAGAQCSANDACCQSCQIAPEGTLCQAATACAAESTCNGIAPQCAEHLEPVGTVCTTSPPSGNPSTGGCFNGGCVSLADQCSALDGQGAGPQYPASPYPAGDCSRLWCNDSPGQRQNTYWPVAVADGTWCGAEQVCVSGTCVQTSSVPTDECPLDPSKSLAGTCGCGVSEDDGDGDGAPDCVDACPSDPLDSQLPCEDPDAGVVDAGVADAGVADAGVADAGVADAGVTDAGSSDGGSLDAGVADAGAVSARDGGTGALARTSGGCSTAGGGTAGFPLLLLFAAFLLARRTSRG